MSFYDWFEVESGYIELTTDENISVVCWTAPPLSLVKVIVDASFICSETRAITTAVIHDHEGLVIGASRRHYLAIHSIFTTEALAVLHGLSLAQDLGCASIQVESDSLAVVKSLNSTDTDRSEIRAITWDAKVKARSFNACDFRFISRQGNRTAHALALVYRSELVEEFWVEEVPPEVLTVVDSDRRWSDPP
ncbi:hypothetical protein HRI_002167000 [Hibiscus trionum]|uniref:RNase H type-1 domain-containing protein n=1 Tax=Hibiscus trionum TaxID=183268 RepID=A0A9W7M0J7_HIBTR|nr:hypothetical protein HRI_002167000 [Hibiscus trionum]